MKRYEAYKNSGVTGNELIPEGWYAVKTKRVLSGLQDGTHGTFSRTDNGYPLLSAKNIQDNGIVIDENESYISLKDYEAIVSHGFPRKNDVALCCVGTIGRCCIYEKDFPMAFQRSVTFLRPNDKITSRFLMYSIKASYFQDQLKQLAKASAQSGIYLNDVANTLLFIPTLLEQKAITAYLDYKVGQIDSAVSAINAQIEDLKAYRQSVISEAVTKGLDKNAKMKDSGIEWIGEIPERWGKTKIKHLFTVVAGATPESTKESFWDGDIAWITPADFKTNDHFVEKGRKTITAEGYDSCATTLVPQGSIIFSKRAPIGSVVIAKSPLCTNQGCLSCVPKPGVSSDFYYYAMSVFTAAFEMKGSGTTFKEISAFDFSDFPMPNPSLEEQKAIAAYLDYKVGQLNEAISALDAQRTDLNVLKQAIISEAVTGKIDVRDWTPSVEQ